METTNQTENCKIAGEHCSQCGSIDLEDLGFGNDDYDGYTFCCNEPATDAFTCNATDRPAHN